MSFSHQHPQLGTLFRTVASSSDIDSPVTPGDIIVYILSGDGELYSKNHSGTVVQLTGAGGSGSPDSLTVFFDDNQTVTDASPVNATYTSSFGSLVGDFDLSDSPDIDVTPDSAGNYLISVRIELGDTGSVSSHTMTVRILINGSQIDNHTISVDSTNRRDFYLITFPNIYQVLANGDFVDISVEHNDSGQNAIICSGSNGKSYITFLKVS